MPLAPDVRRQSASAPGLHAGGPYGSARRAPHRSRRLSERHSFHDRDAAVADPSLADELKSLRIERDAPRGGLPSWAIWLIVLAVLGAAGAFAWQKIAPRIFTPEVDTTTVALVSPAQGQQLLIATGYVVPQHKANIAPRIGGRVAKIFVEDGDQVKRNQLVAILEDADYRAQLAQA